MKNEDVLYFTNYIKQELQLNNYVTFFNLHQARELNTALKNEGYKIGYIELSQAQYFYSDEGKKELLAHYKSLLEENKKKVLQTIEDIKRLSQE